MKSFLKSTASFWMTAGVNIATLFFLLIVSDNTIPDSIQKGILLIISGILLLVEVIIFTMKQNEDLQKIRPYCVVGNILTAICLLWLISVVVWGIKPHIFPMLLIVIVFIVGYIKATKYENKKEEELLKKSDH